MTGTSSLVPVVRNANYNPGSTRVTSEYLTSLILAQTKTVPLDFVDNGSTDDGDKGNNGNGGDINITE